MVCGPPAEGVLVVRLFRGSFDGGRWDPDGAKDENGTDERRGGSPGLWVDVLGGIDSGRRLFTPGPGDQLSPRPRRVNCSSGGVLRVA